MAEKTHKPTEKKLRDARKRGEVAKSRELNSLALFVGVLALLWFGAVPITRHVISVMERAIVAPESIWAEPAWSWLPDMQSTLHDALWVVAPLFGLGLGCTLLMGGLQTRGVFSIKPLAPKFERINPGQGLQNLFSTRQLFELGKMLVKTALLMGLLVASITSSLDLLVKMVYVPAPDLLRIAGTVMMTLMAWAAVIYAVSAVLDYAHQFHEFMKQQKMTTDEVRREMRDTEGDPHIKAQRRSTGREMAFSKMLSNVSSANVVIVNPTHVSVALHYTPGKTSLPRVVAKGIDVVALRIRAEAERRKVPIFEDPPLARRLFRDVAVGQYIGEDLIDAVAPVFRWAKSVVAKQRGPGSIEAPQFGVKYGAAILSGEPGRDVPPRGGLQQDIGYTTDDESRVRQFGSSSLRQNPTPRTV